MDGLIEGPMPEREREPEPELVRALDRNQLATPALATDSERSAVALFDDPPEDVDRLIHRPLPGEGLRALETLFPLHGQLFGLGEQSADCVA